MVVKKIFIILPVVLLIFLFQSYFWVPTYEEQTKGNPLRLTEFITASIGGASLLNPILSADSASSEIESKVFEGLIDRDENLNFRGRIAKSWEIFEEAYFYVNYEKNIPLEKIVLYLSRFKHVRKVHIIKAHKRQISLTYKQKSITLSISEPPRIKVDLCFVDPDFFKKLTKLLGKDYFDSFKPERYVVVNIPLKREELRNIAREVLPAVEHNPVILFHLRKNVYFHDGHKLTAKDVKFTYDSIMDPKNLSPRISDFEPVKSVQIIDPYTVKVTYKRLYSPALSAWSIGILPEHLLNKEALRREAIKQKKDPDKFSLRDSSFNRHPIGSGPFKFKEWKSGQYIILERFENYWEGPPNYKKYIFRIIPDMLTQEMEFYAGTLDIYSAQPYEIERFKKDNRFQTFSGTSFGYTYIGYNLRRKPFDDVRVRRALSMAIDVDKIIKYVLYNQGERITGPFVKQTQYYNKDVKPIPYNPEEALKLLQEAGWHKNKEGWLVKDGKKMQFTLITNSGNEIRKAILAIVQDYWKKIGVDVSTDVLEWSVFIQERINKLDFDAVILGWMMSIEPDLYQIWHSSQTHPYQLNFIGFKNKQADELIEKIRREYDLQRQIFYCHKLHRLIADECPYTFLFVRKWTAVLDKRIVIMEKDRFGHIVYKKITPTPTGDFSFYFNKWIKLPKMPNFTQ